MRSVPSYDHTDDQPGRAGKSTHPGLLGTMLFWGRDVARACITGFLLRDLINLSYHDKETVLLFTIDPYIMVI